jgi:membrane protein implicated in regulation of membrane protease activity
METILSWVATIATITAASITASNLGSRITGYGFIVFTVGSIAWFALGSLTGQPALVWTNAVLTILNLFGIWRWLGRQARIEDGSTAAAQASQERPGEALFPVSLLTRAKVMSGGAQLGTCVDAMAGCGSGRIAYVMVSQGGIAGAGETLRRVEWGKLRADGDDVVTTLDEARFAALEPVPKDQWPTR